MEDAPQQEDNISWCSPLWAQHWLVLTSTDMMTSAGAHLRGQERALPQSCAREQGQELNSETCCCWPQITLTWAAGEGSIPGAALPGTSFQHRGLDLLPVRRWVHARQVGTRVPPATTAGQLLGGRNQRAAQYLARGRRRAK